MQSHKNQKRTKNFQCPCGKSYLSYPALYTHIKQAHGGKAPGQIKRPDTHNRGRPKAAANVRIQQHKKTIEEGIKVNPIPDLLKLIEKQPYIEKRQIRDIYQNEPVYRLIMNDKDKPFVPKFLKQDRIYDVKIGEGVIQFFSQIQSQISNKNMYDEIVMLIVLLTEHIIEQTEDQNVLTLGNIGLMPEFVNYFIIHDLKKPIQRLKLENAWIFRNQNGVQVLNIFFKWMLYKQYTLTKVQINKKYFNQSLSSSDNNLNNSIDSFNDEQSSENQQNQEGSNLYQSELQKSNENSSENSQNSQKQNEVESQKDPDENQNNQMINFFESKPNPKGIQEFQQNSSVNANF